MVGRVERAAEHKISIDGRVLKALEYPEIATIFFCLAEDENLLQDVDERAIDEQIEEVLMKRGRLIGNYYFKCGACVLNPRGKGCQRIIRLCVLKFGIKIAKW
ncbi:DgyrCDS14433 [Dimorphilus gyrociliatus]|uniref:DgyrCDS14433 n=1 Tax=Dimorphilus gyrociliatus TaxID=2664684 RepID=A0A7I8WDL5_9ANNE|nr:DgyrCDS14433 [Dimorphilus gyrociliatus]